MAVLDEEYKTLISAKGQTVMLSDETLAKQRGCIEGVPGHPELTLEDYQNLPRVIANAQLIVQDSEQTLVFFKSGKTIYFAAVKATRSGESLFMTSLRKAVMKDVKAIKKKGKILRDEL
ncbi:MAG: hypothetical protein JXR79_00450 [Nitrospirae bacterium]|nr:hypothetical protein [Nitrospirota bacterium]